MEGEKLYVFRIRVYFNALTLVMEDEYSGVDHLVVPVGSLLDRYHLLRAIDKLFQGQE